MANESPDQASVKPVTTLIPNGAIFIGGALDGRLEETDGRPYFYAYERVSPFTSLNPKERAAETITYRLERFTTGKREWLLYVDTRMTLEEAVAKLFLSYALGADRNTSLNAIEMVR